MPAVNFNKWAYRLVEDRHDGMGKVPVFDQEAFQLGIAFKAKYVGTLEITRPTCRTEIVTAMRKVRYEFKIKGIEKRRVFLTISVDGIKVTLRKRRRRLRKEYLLDEDPVVLHEHQIGRIFYVSHDSMDLKIFSYITKDNFDNQFRCSVFKAYRKSKALFVVRTIGQAFEVCHRLQQETSEETKEGSEGAKKVDERVLADEGTDIDAVEQTNNDGKTTEINENGEKAKSKPTGTLVEISQLLPPVGPDGKTQPFNVEQLRLLFNQQLEHYVQETEVYKAENQLLKYQLMLEKNSREQAQEREKCLLQKNRELLQTIQTLANRLQTVNPGDESLSSAFNTSQQNETLFNPSYPSMHSTPLKSENLHSQPGIARLQLGMNRDQLGLAENSVVITPPADTLATFDPLASKMAPLATLDNSIDTIGQSTVGHYWKTFDEDDVISPGSGLDESSSESSDDENFGENFVGQKIIPTKERNGWVDLSENAQNGSAKHGGNAYAGGLGTTSHPSQQNGIVHNDLKTLHSENNNHFSNSTASTDTRTAIQTDF